MGRAIEVCLAVVALMLLGYAHALPTDLLGSEDRHWDEWRAIEMARSSGIRGAGCDRAG